MMQECWQGVLRREDWGMLTLVARLMWHSPLCRQAWRGLRPFQEHLLTPASRSVLYIHNSTCWLVMTRLPVMHNLWSFQSVRIELLPRKRCMEAA